VHALTPNRAAEIVTIPGTGGAGNTDDPRS
jgi:hypothetical protein